MRAGGRGAAGAIAAQQHEAQRDEHDAEQRDPDRQMHAPAAAAPRPAARRASGSAPASAAVTGQQPRAVSLRQSPSASRDASARSSHSSRVGGNERQRGERRAAVLAPWPVGSDAAGHGQRERARAARSAASTHAASRDSRASASSSRRQSRTSRARPDRRRRCLRTASCTSRRRARRLSTRRAAADRRAGTRAVPRGRHRRRAPVARGSMPCAPVGSGGGCASGAGYTMPASGKWTYAQPRHRPSGKIRRQRDAPERERGRAAARALERHGQRRVRPHVDGLALASLALSVIASTRRRAADERERERDVAARERFARGERLASRCPRGCETCAAAPPRRGRRAGTSRRSRAPARS